MEGLVYIVLICAVVAPIYLLPAIIAEKRNHRNKLSITILNVFFGWTFLGWVISLAMACGADTVPIEPKSPNIINDEIAPARQAETRSPAIKVS